MQTLERLFSTTQKERMLAAIPQRVSCRAFSAEPSPADWAALAYAASRYTLPGARLILMNCPEELFTGTLLNMGRVTGCRAVAVVAASSTVENSRIYAGITGEALALEAVSMGLGACWISGTYRKKLLRPPLADHEAVLAVIALGVPEQPPALRVQRRRKSLEKLCKGELSLWPAELRQVAACVREAPSAMNLQPWTMSFTASRFEIDSGDRSALDLGIALCHAEAALKTPHHWHFAQNRRDPAAWAEV